MIKKYFKYILVCAMSACSDFLIEEPRTFLSPSVAYTTDEGFNSGAVGLYDALSVPYFGSNNFGRIVGLWQAGTDIHQSSNEDGYGIKPIDELAITAESIQISTMWDHYYRIVTNAQTLLTYAEEHDWGDERLGRQVEGEAYFFWAWGHFYLTQFWGDIPVVDRLQREIKLDWERTPQDKVMELVIDYLIKAIDNLEYTVYNNQQGRITKGTALHLLAYAYLCNQDWENAEKYARELIESGHHSLMTNRFGSSADNPEGNPFWDLFQKDNQNPDAGNRESLLVVQNEPVEVFPEAASFDEPGFYSTTVRFFYANYYGGSRVEENDENLLKYGGRGKGYLLSTRYWVDNIFQDEDDQRGQFPNVQKRFERSGGTVAFDWDAPGADKNNLMFRPYPRKWDWDGSSRNGSFGTDATTRDIYVFRLAETYLILAEALHMQGRNSEIDGAAYYINQVRQRAGAAPIGAGEVTIDFILDERARELYGEIPRRIDLVRTDKLVERANLYNPNVNGKADPRHNLLPIPQDIIDLNIHKEFPQNEPAW